jgi:hypothetical protein
VLQRLEVVARDSTEVVRFSAVTFLHGPVGSGKSTVARLIDYCFGGDLVATPAIQSEFIAARLFAVIGMHEVILERGKGAESAVRVTWLRLSDKTADDSVARQPQSVLAPLEAAKGISILDGVEDVENLSDLIFHLGGIRPIQVRRSKRDPEAILVRLSFRDLLFYCYLDQDELDSSFFCFEHPFKRQKSIDAIRFVVGFYSEHLNDLERRLYRAIDDQRTKRASAEQLEHVLRDLDFESELQILGQLQKIGQDRAALRKELAQVDTDRRATTHPLDALRAKLRVLNERLLVEEQALAHLREKLARRESFRAELLTAKVKALRADAAQRVLGQVDFSTCPQCETPVDIQRHPEGMCSLCGQRPAAPAAYEELATEFDERSDELHDLIARQKTEVSQQQRRVDLLRKEKAQSDGHLDEESRRYDAAFLARLRELERGIAEMDEREKNLQHLRRIPARLEKLVREAGELQGEIEALRKGVEQETQRLRHAQTVVQELATRFKELLVRVGFPGMSAEDSVEIDTRSWEPRVYAKTLSWGFGDLGSGGKKVLYKVLYALALHEIAALRGLPLPTFLIVDSPTKNISHDVNPELFEAFYREVYRVAREYGSKRQFLLIDSELVLPPPQLKELFSERLLDHSEEAPPLISYYRGH